MKGSFWDQMKDITKQRYNSFLKKTANSNKMVWALKQVGQIHFDFQKTRGNKCWQGCGEKEILIHCWWEYKLVQQSWESMVISQTIKKETTILPSSPTLGYISKEMEKKQTTDICNNLDRAQGHQAEGKTPISNSHITDDSIFRIRISSKWKPIIS